MKKFLVVVDMQNDFVDGALGTKEAAGIIPAVVNEIKSFDGKVIATMDTHFSNYSETQEGRKLPVPHCIEGTNGWEINPLVADALADKEALTIKKFAFGSCDLPDCFGVEANHDEISIELIGLCTDICVVSNALILKARFPEAEIFVKESCCAGVTPEKHNAAIEVMKSCQIDIR